MNMPEDFFLRYKFLRITAHPLFEIGHMCFRKICLADAKGFDSDKFVHEIRECLFKTIYFIA